MNPFANHDPRLYRWRSDAWQAGYDAAIKDVVALIENQLASILLSEHDRSPREQELNLLLRQIERGEAKGAANE